VGTRHATGCGLKDAPRGRRSESTIDGTHHHVSVEHLPRYLAEFDYRFSTRKLSDTQRMARLMGKRLGGD
jgi:hypothetical protein